VVIFRFQGVWSFRTFSVLRNASKEEYIMGMLHFLRILDADSVIIAVL
jgi:hypothetical protein